MFKPITKVQLIKGGNVIKQGHDFTLEFNLFDDEGTLVELTGASIGYKIAHGIGGVVAEGDAQIKGLGNIAITVTDDIGSGSGKRLEFTVTKGGVSSKFPADDYIRLKITPSLENLEFTGVNTVTLEQFEKKIGDATKRATEEADRAKVHADNIDNVMKNGPVQTVNGQTGAVTGLAKQTDLNTVKTQLAEKAKQVEDLETKKANQTYVDSELSRTAKQAQIDLIETRIEDVIQSSDLSPNKDQEIVDARLGKKTLGEKISDLNSDVITVSEKTGKLPILKEPINKDIYRDKNMVDKFILNNTNGELVIGENYCTTFFISINPTTNYHVGLISTNETVSITRLCFYDANENFISYESNKTSFTSPENAYYVRLSFASSRFSQRKNIKIQLDSLSKITPYEFVEDVKMERYEALKLTTDSVSVDNLGYLTTSDNEDIFYNKYAEDGKSLDANGNIVTNLTRCTTGFIEVKPNTTYYLGRISDNQPTNIQQYAYYDEHYNLISRGSNENALTAPANTKYIRLSLATVHYATLKDIKFQKNELSLLEPYRSNVPIINPRYENVFPEHYQDEVDNTIHKILENAEEQSVNFIFITDLHVENNGQMSKSATKRQFEAINEISNNSPIDFVCVGGDLFSGNNFKESKQVPKDLLKEIVEPLKDNKKTVVVLKGNHDDNSYYKITNPTEPLVDELIINANEYASYTNGTVQGVSGGKNNYYYFDIKEKNTRVVCLNASDYPLDKNEDGTRKNAGMNYFGYSIEQMEWFLNEALDDSNKKYIILSHMGTDHFTIYNRSILMDILTALQTKETYVGLDTSKDFSNYNGFELYAFGHLHADKLEKSDKIGDGIALGVGSAWVDNTPISQGETDNGYRREIGREFGKISEALFDVIINTENEVKRIRFGAGEDETLEK